MKLKCLLIFIFSVIFSNNIISCNINIDSLFNSHISSIDKYLKSVIDGYILPTGDSDNLIFADITGKPIKTDYTDSTKFYIYKDNAFFLETFEDISSYNWERDSYAPNILVSRQEILMIKDWYEANRIRLNCDKIQGIYLWYKNYNKYIQERGLSDRNSVKDYLKEKERLKRLNTFIDIE